MRATLAIAGLRIREGLAARLPLLVVLAFLAGVGAAVWAPGGDAAARAATADRAAFGLAFAVALLVAVVLPGLGFPADLKRRRAFTLLAAPVSRFSVVLGGALGYGAVASALLLASAVCATLGLAAGGAPSRGEIRGFATAQLITTSEDGAKLDREHPEASFRVPLPDGSADGDTLPVRLRVSAAFQAGEPWSRTTGVALTLVRDGEMLPVADEVIFHPVDVARTELTLPTMPPRSELELRVRRLPRGWQLTLPPDALSLGQAPEPFAWNVIKAALCAAPLLFLAGAAAQCGAVRFGAPTALGLAMTLLLVFAGQDVLREAAGAIERSAEAAAEMAREREAHAGHGHAVEGDGHAHDVEVGTHHVALARGVRLLLGALPAPGPFDRSDDLVQRVAIPAGAIGHSASIALLPFVGLVGLGWILVRRRELIPR